MNDVPEQDKVWIDYKDRWYPGVLETWNTKGGQFRFWVSYAVPVNGWPGGWYAQILGNEEGDPNGEDLSWDVRVEEARAQASQQG